MVKKRKKNNNKKLLVGMMLILLILGTVLCVIFLKNKNENVLKNKDEKTATTTKEVKKLKIVDLDSNSRNIAVMVNNIKGVWGKQAGLQDAYLVYEITVEGGITRFMAVYRDQDTKKIGSVRSARPYYLDYVMENDAIYEHIGGSEQAKKDIKTLKINDLGVYERDRSVSKVTEYTAFTSMEKLKSAAKKRGYRMTSDQPLLFNYSIDEIDLSKMEGAKKADEVIIKYNSKDRSYKYDEENKVYLRYQGGDAHVDYVTKEQYTVKNIITYKVKNATIMNDKKGRQELDNIGKGEGYYISNGWAVPITWEKTSRSSKTKYRYLNGDDVVLNDGNTFIQIQPKNKDLEIKSIELNN